MRIGTPNFISGRLIDAREARGLTAVSLSQMIEVSPATISHYEHGRQSPSPEILERLAMVLNCPLKFFLNPTKPLPDLVEWRSFSSATKTSRSKAIRRFGWLREAVEYLKELLEFPRVAIPDIKVPDEIERIDSDMVESAANQCREFWSLGTGPIPNVIKLLEANGVIVSRTDLEAETLDAFSVWPTGEEAPYVVLSSLKASAARSRFDAAHELGHLVLHRNLSSRGGTAGRKLVEEQAHRFAGAFLLPEASFSHDVWAPTLNSFRTLKPHWKTSIQLMIMRCKHLGIIGEGQARRAWINLSRRNWRKVEPLDDMFPVEEPQLLRRSFEILVSEGVRSPEQISTELQVPAADIEDLCGLPHGFLRGVTDREVRPRLKNQSPDERRGVVTFPSRH